MVQISRRGSSVRTSAFRADVPRSGACDLFEDFVEVCGVVVAALQCDGHDRQFGGAEQVDGFVDAFDIDILPWRETVHVLEHGTEVGFGNESAGGDVRKGEVVTIIFVNKIQRGFHAFAQLIGHE